MIKKYLKIIKRHFSCIFVPFPIWRIRFLNPKAFIDRGVKIVCSKGCYLSIGASGISRFSTLIVCNDGRNCSNNSRLTIGDNTYVGEYNNIRAGGGEICIGDNCLISQHITIVCSNHGIKRGDLIRNQNWSITNNFVKIEDDVWVGSHSVILPGVTIHKGAVIAAGSIVTKDVPEYAVVAGNPAKILKYRE